MNNFFCKNLVKQNFIIKLVMPQVSYSLILGICKPNVTTLYPKV